MHHPVTLKIVFEGNLKELLHPRLRVQPEVKHTIHRRASIKDIIESLRVPHPEVKKLLVNDRETDFSHIARDGDRIRVYPLSVPQNVLTATLLRPVPLPEIRFIADANVGKLARLLRMAGMDTAYEPQLSDKLLAEISAREGRILLSRDRNILKRGCVTFGHLVREEIPEKQLAEIINLYGLHNDIKQFSRCLQCNRILKPVEKKDVLHRLKPRTKKYYTSFHYCSNCDKVYWQGSHRTNMNRLLGKILDGKER